MRLKICILASGSAGNSIHVASDTTDILIDAGLSGRQIKARLGTIGKKVENVDAVLISHEHSDHIRGLRFIDKKTSIPVYLNSATSRAVKDRGFPLSRGRIFTNNSPFTLGDIRVTPFSVMHDASDPVGFAVSAGEVKISIATDLGHATHLVKDMLRGSHAIVIEANHDPRLLRDHPRPWALKQRIKSRQGHLSNESAASLIEEVATEKLQAVFLAHISSDCNRPQIGIEKISRSLARLGFGDTAVIETCYERPTGVFEISIDNDGGGACASYTVKETLQCARIGEK